MSYEKTKELYSKYLELKCSRMLDGRYGNAEAQRRMFEIRKGLNKSDMEMRHLLLDCDEEIKKYTRKAW